MSSTHTRTGAMTMHPLAMWLSPDDRPSASSIGSSRDWTRAPWHAAAAPSEPATLAALDCSGCQRRLTPKDRQQGACADCGAPVEALPAAPPAILDLDALQHLTEQADARRRTEERRHDARQLAAEAATVQRCVGLQLDALMEAYGAPVLLAALADSLDAAADLQLSARAYELSGPLVSAGASCRSLAELLEQAQQRHVERAR